MSTFIYLPPVGDSIVGEYWGAPAVATSASLPPSGTQVGQVYAVIDEVALYMWDGDSWENMGDGMGDVTGPASSTANAVARYNGTGGKTIKDSGVVVDDSNNVTGVATLTATAVTAPTVRGATTASADLTLSSTSNATKGKIILGSLSAYDEVNDRLGLGTTSPAAPIHIRNDSDLSAAGSGLIRLENQNNSATSDPHVEFRRARASNADLQNGDTVGAIDFHPRHNSNYTNAAQIHCIYTGNGTTRSADLTFDTGNNGAPTERMRISAAGVITMGNNPVTVDANGGMSFATTTSAFRLPNLTTAQRDALTPAPGQMIYNTTIDLPQIYVAGTTNAWTSFLGWGDPQ